MNNLNPKLNKSKNKKNLSEKMKRKKIYESQTVIKLSKNTPNSNKFKFTRHVLCNACLRSTLRKSTP